MFTSTPNPSPNPNPNRNMVRHRPGAHRDRCSLRPLTLALTLTLIVTWYDTGQAHIVTDVHFDRCGAADNSGGGGGGSNP